MKEQISDLIKNLNQDDFDLANNNLTELIKSKIDSRFDVVNDELFGEMSGDSYDLETIHDSIINGQLKQAKRQLRNSRFDIFDLDDYVVRMTGDRLSVKKKKYLIEGASVFFENSKISVGDKVKFKGDSSNQLFEVIAIRNILNSKLKAFKVKNIKTGKVVEYDQEQLEPYYESSELEISYYTKILEEAISNPSDASVTLKYNNLNNFTKVELGDATIFFSFKTLVAFEHENLGGLNVHENIWSGTTGKHLNSLDKGDSESRLSRSEFNRKLKKLKI